MHVHCEGILERCLISFDNEWAYYVGTGCQPICGSEDKTLEDCLEEIESFGQENSAHSCHTNDDKNFDDDYDERIGEDHLISCIWHPIIVIVLDIIVPLNKSLQIRSKKEANATEHCQEKGYKVTRLQSVKSKLRERPPGLAFLLL